MLELKIIPYFAPYYRYVIPIFVDEKEPENYFSYKSIDISDFRGLGNVSINFSKNDLVVLLGLNESGKTSILKAIECFDYNNDPDYISFKSFFTSIRNKQDINCSTPSIITAQIEFSEPLSYVFFRKALKSAKFPDAIRPEVDAFLEHVNETQTIRISRVIPFNNGDPGKSYYQFEEAIPLSDDKLEAVLAQEVVRRCPYILYFEDFQDAIPDKIYARKQSEGFNPVWYEIIDGLFYNTDPTYSIANYLRYYLKDNIRDDDARTVLKKVNKTLQETFTQKWENLSGVKEIDEAEITFQESKKYFEIKITENDGTTYSVHERSKGAIWYLAFLMKTEFRRKKLREGSGKPIYLIDEPASNLHSTAQTKMVEDFIRLVEDTTVIYTTHSRYLISRSNVKNTYVVGRSDGVVSCTKWGEYIKRTDAKISYYQPLYDCLEIVPNHFEIPWEKAIITEGPSDSATLRLMELVLGKEVTHVIYPGSSASNLSTLISLNIGWLANFKVLLDSDAEGKRQKKRYIEEFSLREETFVLLPGKYPKIEKMFSQNELSKLYEFAMGEKLKFIAKKQFNALMQTLLDTASTNKTKISSMITESTKTRFSKLLNELKEN